MKAYAIAAETVKDQATFDTYRKVVPETLISFGTIHRTRGEHDRCRRRMAASPVGDHRISLTRRCGRLVQVGRVSKSDLAAAQQCCRKFDHRRRDGLTQSDNEQAAFAATHGLNPL